MLQVLARATGEAPHLWGSIIGFGQYHYKYPSGREGDVAAAGFAPRKAATTIYLVDGVGRHEQQLERLGLHTTGVGCLYIKDLDRIDLSVVEAIVAESHRTVTAGTYMLRAREGTRAAERRGRPPHPYVGASRTSSGSCPPEATNSCPVGRPRRPDP